MWEGGVVTFGIVELMTSGEGAAAFNYFFTLMCISGIVSVMVGLLVKLLTRT